MALYTLIIDFRGGTYISQAVSESPKAAAKKCILELKLVEIEGMGPAIQKEIILEIDTEKLTPLKGIKNVWCMSSNTKMGLALLNIVETID